MQNDKQPHTRSAHKLQSTQANLQIRQNKAEEVSH